MEKFSYLVKQRNKALGLFEKVVRRLDDVHKSMHSQVESETKTIEEHEGQIKDCQERIDEGKAAIAFLEAEKTKTIEHRKKISALMTVEGESHA